MSLLPLLLLPLAQGASFACTAPDDPARAADAAWRIRVDVRPFDQPAATYVEVDSRLGIQRIDYSAPLLEVLEYHRSPLSEADADRFGRSLAAPELRRALDAPRDPGRVGTSGDLYEVWVSGAGIEEANVSGLLADSDPATRSLVAEVLSAGQAIQAAAAMPPGFVRAEPIDPVRRRAIERRGLVTFVAAGDLSPELAALVSSGAARAEAFLPLDEPLLHEIETLLDEGRELFIRRDGDALQVALYLPRGTPPPQAPAPGPD